MTWVDRRKLSAADEKLVGDVAKLLAEPAPAGIPVFEMPTTYTVSVLPLDHEEYPFFAVTVVAPFSIAASAPSIRTVSTLIASFEPRFAMSPALIAASIAARPLKVRPSSVV